ncbi:hypothetical protein [Bradyrhizobium symbiodeficiens]|uniref:Uncharacterized protein n=1 Tax=Bradyrhizobium symbiodeficiens TaxID=1404367 RepID=A0A6G9A1V3_9BRAD|nr:hypothetical protein [Bradyrhizobium symbiodeficiens]QIP06421.1 hypothetical protein HAV00_09270 [Bradyrhizobium symbiodeficiens]
MDAPKPAVAAAKSADPAKPDTRRAQTQPALKPSVSDGAGEATQIVGAGLVPYKEPARLSMCRIASRGHPTIVTLLALSRCT